MGTLFFGIYVLYFKISSSLFMNSIFYSIATKLLQSSLKVSKRQKLAKKFSMRIVTLKISFKEWKYYINSTHIPLKFK